MSEDRHLEIKKQTNKTACCRLQIPMYPSNNQRLHLTNFCDILGVQNGVHGVHLGGELAHVAVNTGID